MLIQYIGYIKVTVGTSGPGYHGKCQLKWSTNVASEAHGELHCNLRAHGPETYRKLHGNLEPQLQARLGRHGPESFLSFHRGNGAP